MSQEAPLAASGAPSDALLTNITDKYYFQGAFENLNSGFAVAQPARPREWALSVTKCF